MINRRYKDTLFRLLFSDKIKLLELYNALNGTHYEDPDDLTINTLEDAVYMNFKNDLSFILHAHMPLYEHQSTVNPNLPLRDLDYVNRLLRGITNDKDLYGRSAVKVPAPEFVVFYNGEEKLPERSRLMLSDLYQIRQDDPALELKITVFNINPGFNAELMATCKTLSDYSQFTNRVRTYLTSCKTEEERLAAVNRAIDECISEGILADFLSKHREEAIGMSLFEYDEEKHMKTVRDESYAEGVAEGRAEGRAEGIDLELVNTIDHACANPELNWTPDLACKMLGKDLNKYLAAKDRLQNKTD